MSDRVAHPSALQRVADDITLDWLGTFSPETIDRFVHESYSPARSTRVSATWTGRWPTPPVEHSKRPEPSDSTSNVA
jgi:hypothetical protein